MKPENWMFEHYHEFAEKIAPVLRAALAGQREIPSKKPFSEAWMGVALFYNGRIVPLEEVIGTADGINHGIPNPNEVAWAFLRLRKRGWLAVQGDSYGLTSEGRRAMASVVGEGGVLRQAERLKEWVSAHQPPSE